MAIKRYKYPKIFHFPWSPGLQNDDRLLESTANFIDEEVVVSVKLDGENTTIYPDHCHARSIDSSYHPSRTWISKLSQDIGYLLEEDERICGENLAAKHSIYYKNMESFFYVFSYWKKDACQTWDETVKRCKELGLLTVPVIYRGVYDEDIIKRLWKPTYNDNDMEGYVVRISNYRFHISDFQRCVAKYVRKGHVQTGPNWMLKPVEWNDWKRK